MKSLLIMRHAEAGWHTGSASDFERPLTPKGTKDVAAMAQLFRRCALLPDLVISSPAFRAKQTAEGVIAHMESVPPVQFDERLYGAPLEILLKVIRTFPEQSKQVLLVGHNPGLEELVCWFCDCQRKNTIQLSPASVAYLQCGITHWTAMETRQTILQWCITPRLIAG